MKRALILTLLLGACIFVPDMHAKISDQVASANASLAAGRPIEALDTYKSLLASPEFASSGSAELWCNRGLAEEKTGDAAAASLSFRRALLLDPGFTPARHQLSTVLGILGLPTSWGWKEKLYGVVHPDIMILGGAAAGWLGLLSLVALLMTGARRRSLIAVALILFVVGQACSVLGTVIDPRRTAWKEAVVTSKSATVMKATPADNAASSGTLTPGTLITILSRNGAWWYVSPGSGLSGWIPSDTTTPLLPSSKGS